MGRESRQARRARERRQQQQQRKGPQSARSGRWPVFVGAGVIGLVVIALVIAAFTQKNSTSAAGSATATSQAEYTPVPGLAWGPVRCSFNEMVGAGFYHVHAHLTILHDGKSQTVPSQIGFLYDKDCLTWVHTHSPSEGIIHIESPYKIVPTLGNFFGIWGQPLSRDQVWKFKASPGQVKVFVNQKPYTGNPADIKMYQHTDITIEIGKPFSPPKKFPFGKYGV